MTTKKYTRGPWKTHLGFQVEDGEIYPLTIFTDDGRGNGLPIAFRDDVEDRLAEAKANAALIDGVHELLAAAEYALHSVLEPIVHESGYWNGVLLPSGGEQSGNFLTVVDAVQRLSCAIAKACDANDD